VTRVLTRARGTLTIVTHLPGQRGAHYRPRAEVEAARDARVLSAAGYAARSVPYYRDLLAREGIDAREVRTAGDLRRLPVVERAAVQASPEAFRARARAGRSAIEFRTTGSTAMPLVVHHSRSSLLANIAYGERERLVEQAFLARRRQYSAFDVRATGGTLPRVQAFYAASSYRPFRPRRRDVSVDDPPRAVIAAINEARPEVIRSYGGYLERLFRVAAATGELRHLPTVVSYAGDTMSDGGRALIEREFGIPVLSAYNAVESFKIGFTCERRSGFHLHEDLCDVRIVDGAGREVEPGERGEVVISNLVNRATVLLNYRLGDVARLEHEPCECGRTTRRLVDLEGRVDDIIELGSGEYVYPTRVWRVFRERPEILRYQLIQHELERFELRVVAADVPTADRAATEAVDELRSVLGGADVVLTRFEDLPNGPGGKFRHLVPLARPAAVGSKGIVGTVGAGSR
jgi:phenylacetate-CoA ligase